MQFNWKESMKDNDARAIFDRNTVEFVTVSAEFCGFLERVSEKKRKAFVDTSLKLLPLLYLKASLLPECVRLDEADPETFVTEGDYELVRSSVSALLAEYDDYLDVFLDDITVKEVSDALQVPVDIVKSSGQDLINAMLGPDTERIGTE